MLSLAARSDVSASSGPAAPPAALEEAARALEVVSPRERRSVLRGEAALLLDGLLVRVARGRVALDVALCEGLGALSVGDRLLSLGWSGVGDYARERLGVAARTGQVMARLGRALAERPLLRAAVRSGEVSIRAAEEIVTVAVGDDEAAWVERARSMTVRGLVAAVRAARLRAGAPSGAAAPDGTAGVAEAAQARAAESEVTIDVAPPEAEHLAAGAEDGEPWQRISLEVSSGARDALVRALDLAGRVLGEGAPRWQRLEAVAQEYLGAHGADEADEEVVAGALAAWRGESLEDWAAAGSGGDAAGGAAHGAGDAVHAAPGWRAELETYLEEETRRWEFLEEIPWVTAPPVDEAAHPARLDATLRELAALRERWESLLGHLALLVRMLGLWRDMQFVSFSHYCRERLGISVRSVEQRIALERRLHSLPSLRAALTEGRLDAERARLVARLAEEPSAAEWIGRAERMPVVALRREVEALEAMPHVSWMVAAQRCAPDEPVVALRLRVPVRVAALLAAAFRAAQRAPSPDGRVRWRSESECLLGVASHFIEAWRDLPQARSTPQRRALRRDGHRCQVPGCSRAAVHAHHVRYRSRGGGDEAENLVSLCAAHHLHGVHRGFVRVRGVAPGGLEWELGEQGRQGTQVTAAPRCSQEPGEDLGAAIAARY
jgi:hypothetical protein